MDLALADTISVRYLPIKVRHKIAIILDVPDTLHGQRDYIEFGINLLGCEMQEIRALRANTTGSITQEIFNNAVKRNVSIKKVWDTLKKMDVIGCEYIEQAWGDIVEQYQTSRPGTENLESCLSNCHCLNCPTIHPNFNVCNIPISNQHSITDNNTCNTFGTHVPLYSLDQNHFLGVNDMYPCMTGPPCTCRINFPTAEHWAGDREQTVRKTPLNSVPVSTQWTQPGAINWLPPSCVSSDTRHSSSPNTLSSHLDVDDCAVAKPASITTDFIQMAISSRNPSHPEHQVSGGYSPMTGNQNPVVAGQDYTGPCDIYDNETTSMLRRELKTQAYYCSGYPCQCPMSSMQYLPNQNPAPISPTQSDSSCQCYTCKRNTAPPGTVDRFIVWVPVTRRTQSCANPLQTLNRQECQRCNNPSGDPQTKEKIQIVFNDKLPYVFITSGQKENGECVHKLVMKFIAHLEKNGINVVAPLVDKLYCSKVLTDGPVREMESYEKVLEYFLKQAACVIMAITPGYCSFVGAGIDKNSKECEVEPDIFRQQVLHVYTLMYTEFVSNGSKNHRFFPVKLNSKKIATEDEHIPEWIKLTLIYIFTAHKISNDLLDHLKPSLVSP
ncbi:uncharacterized protein LOC121381020 [Gigantopelta aegis]|uniref:uncharacterized protein LOC121381020 n=1 Tax=Gigantopelta aegis TaxID=1735272 RepID=UPI001B88B46F|nr:uncharacterized protein LOC121381020 [Gigantopelta aegis]